MIVVYGIPNCARCDQVKNILDNKGIDYKYKTIDKDIRKESLEFIVGRTITSAPIILDGTANEITFNQLVTQYK